VTFARDPLSARYDGLTARFLGRALAAPGRWHYVAVTRPSAGPLTRNWLRSHGITLDAVDSGGLTAYERAYLRSLYHVARELKISVPLKDDPKWSLQREWGPVTAQGRMLGIRLSSPGAARRAVRRKPAAERYVNHGGFESMAGGPPAQK
jgi:hypothetical protein